MTIQAQLADGRVLEFPDGTDPQVIQSTVKRMISEQPQARDAPLQPTAADLSPFPEERGETRAAKELPEVGSGGLLSDQDSVKIAAIAPALLTTVNDQEFADIITSNFPDIGLQQSPAGELILANNNTGNRVIVNKPGISKLDVLQAIGIGAAFFPAGKLATLGSAGARVSAGTLSRRAAQGVAASGAIQAGIEGVQAASGGEVDPGDIALSAAFGGAAELAVPAISSGAGTIREFIRAAPDREAAQVIAAGEREGVRVLTSDVVPPETFFGRSIQQLGEKIGFLGTGGARAQQQRARQDVVRGIADEFNITSVNDTTLPNIIESLTARQATELAEAATQRNAATAVLDQFGRVPVSATNREIARQIARQTRLGEKGNTALVTNLQDIRSSIGGDFSLVKDIRTEVISDLRALSRSEDRRAEGALQAVKSAIDKDMAVFARKNDRGALRDWLQSNRKFAFELSKSRDTELKRLIQKGDVSPEVVGPILNGGKLSELNRLNTSLTPAGQGAARVAIIKNALESSGFFNAANPDRLATILNKPKTQRAIGVFFRGDDRRRLEGLVRLLDSTRRAQQAALSTPTGQQLIPVAATGGVIANPLAAFLTGGTLAAVTRGYESRVVRDALLKLRAMRPGSAEESELIRELSPAITAATQSIRKSQEQ